MAVRTRGQYLVIDFRCYLPNGRKARCIESTGLKDSARNRKVAEAKDKAIAYELKHGRFNYLHFFPDGSKARYFKATPDDMLFSEWWDQWMAEKSIRPNTAQFYNALYSKHINPHFGSHYLSQITEHEILTFRKCLEEIKALKISSVNQTLKILCMCLSKAHKRGLVNGYACEDIKPLTENETDIQPFSFDELNYLLETARTKKPEWYNMLLLWTRTGLRPGEMCALKWEHVDFYNRKLLIRQTRHNNGTEGPPKTRHSKRDIDLRPAALEALTRQREKTGLLGRHIFLTHDDKPLWGHFMRKQFEHLLRLAGLPHRSPVQLRHTFATLHIAAGENISWVSKTMGHSTVQITLKRYNRYVPNLTREDGSAFDNLMDEKSKKGNNLVTKFRK